MIETNDALKYIKEKKEAIIAGINAIESLPNTKPKDCCKKTSTEVKNLAIAIVKSVLEQYEGLIEEDDKVYEEAVERG